MANPMPDIFSGFTGGMQQGLQMGLLLRQQREQKDQQNITNALNMVKINTDLLGVKGLPAENKQKLFGNVLSVFKKYGDKIGLDKDSIPNNITWTDDNAQYAKEMSTIIDTWKSGGFGKNIYDAEPITQLKTGLLGIANRFGESLKTTEALSIGESLAKETKDTTRKTLTVQIGDEVVEVIESEATPGQYEVMKIDGKEVRGPKKPLVEVSIGDQKKEEERKQSALTKANIIVEKVDDALSKVGYMTAGAGGTIMGKIPGTEAVDLEQILETIRAQIGFNELTEMRRQSPTGGALGQVAVRELELLSATLGSLDRRQSPEQLKKSLTDIKTHYLNWKKAVEDSKGDKKSGEKLSTEQPNSGSKFEIIGVE